MYRYIQYVHTYLVRDLVIACIIFKALSQFSPREKNSLKTRHAGESLMAFLDIFFIKRRCMFIQQEDI